MENKTFYGDGLTFEVLQYQFYIFFKKVQGHWGKNPQDCVALTTPPLEVYLHIYFKTQTHQ